MFHVEQLGQPLSGWFHVERRDDGLRKRRSPTSVSVCLRRKKRSFTMLRQPLWTSVVVVLYWLALRAVKA